MDWVRRTLGYQVDLTEHERVARRLQEQQLRLSSLDVSIEAGNAAPRRERRLRPR